MLTNDDLEFMKNSQKEIRVNRTTEIMLVGYEVVGQHPVTKERITEEVSIPINAVLTIVASTTANTINTTKWMAEGVEIISGDIIADVDVDLFPDNIFFEDIDSFIYEDFYYKVKAVGKLGFGIPSRIEFLGRRAY